MRRNTHLAHPRFDFSAQTFKFYTFDFLVPNGIPLNPDQDYFNSDIICYHGNLCIQEAKRRLVCWEVWKKFQSYFPDARAFPKSTKPCNFCMENDDKTRKAIEYKKELANR